MFDLHDADDRGRLDPRRISWTRLLDDHDRITRQCAAILTLVGQPERAVDTAVALLLELAVIVADHMGVEDEVIDLTAAAMDAGALPHDGAAMVAALDALKADWTAFLVAWTPAAIAADWPAFAAATHAILPRLAAQVRRENELLYAEAFRRGVIDRGQPIVH